MTSPSCTLRLALYFSLVFLQCGLVAQEELGEVNVGILLGPDLTVQGGGDSTWSGTSFPVYGSQGRGVVSSRFIQVSGEVPSAGSALLELSGPNTARLLFRDKDREQGATGLNPFFSTTLGLYYLATPKDEAQKSIFDENGARIENEGVLQFASDNGTIVFTDRLEGSVPNISVIRPGESAKTLVKRLDPVPGLEGVTFNGLMRLHVNPNGRVAFASSLQGPGVDFSNDWALFRESSEGVIELIVREGDPYPPNPRLPAGGVIFEVATNQTGFGFNGTGAAAFVARHTRDEDVFESGSSLWYRAPSGELVLVGATGVPHDTATDGTVVFQAFSYSYTGSRIPPVVDSSGDVVFVGTPLEGTQYGRPALWRWDPDSEELPLSKIIDLDSLPFDAVENQRIGISDLCLSPRGRIALIGVVASGTQSLAQAIWAQDDVGNFANVITQSPFPEAEYARQNIVLEPGAEPLRVGGLGTPSGVYNDASGGEDGLMIPWWTPAETLLFSASIRVGETIESYICEATIGKAVEIPSGVVYTWDGGLSTLDWHDIENGKTNWVDAKGVRWDEPPTASNAEVIIPEGFAVVLTQPVNEIASLYARGDLELFANLTVREVTSLGNVRINGDNELVLKGEVTVEGEIDGGNSGLRVIGSLPSLPVTTQGSIAGVNTGIHVTADDGVILDNESSVFALNSVAMWAVSDLGDIVIRNRGSVTSSNGSGIVASSVSGSITIVSPDSGSFSPGIEAVGSGIDAFSAGDVDITFNGEIGVFASDEINDDWAIRSESANGTVSVVSKGDITATGTFGPGGIFAMGQGSVLAKHEGTLSVSSNPIKGVSAQGDVSVDGRSTFISSGLGGLWAEAPNGNATVLFEGEMAAGQSNGIQATAGVDILVESKGPIQTIGSISPARGAHGILANSTGGNIVVNHSGDISTFHTFGSDGMSIRAAQDITINSSGSVSTFSGSGIVAESASGFVDIKHQGTVDASNRGHGIYASSDSGAISIVSDDPFSSINATGDDSAGTALEAIAGGSVLIEWAGDINAWGSRVSAVGAVSRTAGVNVSTKGSVAANGSGSHGVLLSGPSSLTLNLLGGTVSGADDLGIGVLFVGGTENRISNLGTISANSFQAISAGSGNETIDNHGQIFGSIDLGAGTNVIENRVGALLVTHNHLILGAGNVLNNSGHLQIGELGEETLTTAMVGNLFLEASSALRIEIEDTDLEGLPIADKLVVNGNAVIDGELIIGMQEFYDTPETGDTFTILSADSVSGNFFSTRVLNGSNRAAGVSRKVRIDVGYTPTSVDATVALLAIERYSDWREGFFSESDAADETVSGAGKDPDGDGYNNLAEYALGGDPGSLDSDLVRYDIMEGSTVVTSLSSTHDSPTGSESVASISFNWANDVADATWEIERSPDLENWIVVDASEILMEPNGDYTRITATPQISISPDEDLFLRLQIEEIPQPE